MNQISLFGTNNSEKIKVPQISYRIEHPSALLNKEWPPAVKDVLDETSEAPKQ